MLVNVLPGALFYSEVQTNTYDMLNIQHCFCCERCFFPDLKVSISMLITEN